MRLAMEVVRDILLFLLLWALVGYVLFLVFWPYMPKYHDLSILELQELARRKAQARQGLVEPHEQVMARLREPPEEHS